MESAAQQTPEFTGFDPGVGESQVNNRIFVNLRAGKIGQTSNEPREGYVEHKSYNKSGKEYTFYAKTLDHLTGYVNDIKWHVHTLTDGTKLSGWNITVDTGESGVYVLGIGTMERAFQHVMNCFVNVDFSKAVRFIGFWGRNQFTNQPQKVFLLTQGLDPQTNKPVWVKPGTEQKWLSRLIIKKLKEGIDLSEQEERNVSRMHDGKFNKDFPYIVENMDGSWSFDVWNNFLMEQMNEVVIPNMQIAAEARNHRVPPPIVPDEDIPGDVAAPPAHTKLSDDDIPF